MDLLHESIRDLAGMPAAVSALVLGFDDDAWRWRPDEGATWSRADTVAYWGLDVASPAAGWLVGPDGRIIRISFE